MLSVVLSFNSMSSLTCVYSLSASFNSSSFFGDGLPQASSAGVASGNESVSMGTTWSFVSAECLQGPLKTFSLITKIAKHYLQSKYYLKSECLLVSDTRCTPDRKVLLSVVDRQLNRKTCAPNSRQKY